MGTKQSISDFPMQHSRLLSLSLFLLTCALLMTSSHSKDPHETFWNRNIEALKSYKEANGGKDPPTGHMIPNGDRGATLRLGAKQPIRDLSVRQPAALFSC